MGLTLDELKIIKMAVMCINAHEIPEALRLIEREIKLKLMNPVTGQVRDEQETSNNR